MLRPPHQLGPQRIAFHIAAHGQEMLIGLDWKRLETTLVKRSRSGRPVMRMSSLGVRGRQTTQELGQVAVPVWPKDQMPMIRHQTKGQNPHGQPILGLAQDLFPSSIVSRFVKDLAPAHSTVEQVVSVAATGTE